MVKNNSQPYLALLFAIALTTPFLSVWGVSVYYESNGGDTVLFETDSDTEFSALARENYPYYVYPMMQTGRYYETQSPLILHNISKTPVFIGNNTWSFASNYSNLEGYAQYVIELPDVSNMVISSINITTGKPLDADLRMTVRIISVADIGIVDYVNDVPLVNLMYNSLAIESESSNEFSVDIPVSLVKALQVNANAQGKEQHVLVIQILDEIQDGGLDFAFNFNAEIKGTSITTWSIIDTTNVVLILSLIFVWMVIVFATDSIDAGGYIKNLKGRKGGK